MGAVVLEGGGPAVMRQERPSLIAPERLLFSSSSKAEFCDNTFRRLKRVYVAGRETRRGGVVKLEMVKGLGGLVLSADNEQVERITRPFSSSARTREATG